MRSESTINKQTDLRYGRQHRAARRAFKTKLIAHGHLPCFRCGKPVYWNKPFHLDHLNNSDTLYGGVSHPVCNLKHQIHRSAKATLLISEVLSAPTMIDGVTGAT